MAKTVVGLMDSHGQAESVIREITSLCGCERSDIGLIARGSVPQKGTLHTHRGEGQVAEGAAGGAIGGLAKLGVPEEEAHYYAEGVRRGGTLVTVRAKSDAAAECAAEVMRRHVGGDIEERAAQWKQEGWSGRFEATEGEQVLPVVEEELAVGKREVSRGSVRVQTKVSQTPVEEKVQLREEHARVERRPVDRPVSASDDVFREKTIEVREMAEEPVVEKRGRVTEEITVGKDVSQREETVRDTVRKTEVQVEQQGAQGRAGAFKGTERRKSDTAYAGAERRNGSR